MTDPATARAERAVAQPPRAPAGRRVSVRARLLGWVVGLTALGMVVAAVLTYVVQVSDVQERVDAALQQEVEEFRQLARTGIDPATGEPFTSVDALFVTALQRNVTDVHQSFLTLIGSEVRYVPSADVSLHLESDAEFVRTVAEVPPDAPVVIRDGTVQGRDIRYAAVPVRIEGTEPRGTYVVAYDLEAERAEVSSLARTSAVVDLLSLLLVALVGGLVAGRLLRPVRLLRETAERISATGLDERIPVTGRDDVSDLARTFNAMLDRLQQAFAAQRQFMDDAGHELRTPVTILRGHLELLDPDDPRDVAETRALLLDELDRMTRLVDDLTLLAKSRRPDFFRPAPVELGRLLQTVAEKAAALSRRTWTLDEVPPAVVVADGQRLEQALLQLAVNADRHTPPDAAVGIGGHVRDGTVRLWVRDDGPGVAPEDSERIFERFGRAAQTGRGGEGSGLGLAIVRAIAEGSGGRVTLDSAPGRGARFTIEIPDVPAEPAVAGSGAGRQMEDG